MLFSDKNNMIVKNLKQFILIGLMLGITLGFILGMVKGLIYIYSNRYLEIGMYPIAFYSLHSIVNYFSVILLFVFLATSLTIFFIYFILTGLLKDTIRINNYTHYIIITIILVVSLLITGYRLNKSHWYPPFFSLTGFSYNAVVTMSFCIFGFIVFKKLARIGEFSARYLLPMIPRFAILTLFLIIMLNGFFYYRQFKSNKSGLNVLFITVDTLRADHLGCYGYMRDTSPHIDRLAQEGVLFSQGIVQWPLTTPSFASMLTGTYGYHNGVIRISRQKIRDYFVLLPEILKNANYSTVGIVTNGNLAAAYNFNQGLDTYIETWRDYGKSLAAEDAENVTQYALSWLEDNVHKGKFFMWLHYIDPHFQYKPPEPYNEMYVGDNYYTGSQRVKFNPGQDDDIGGISGRSRLGNHDLLDYYIAQYDAEIRYMDENIGKVLDTVEAMGLSDSTIIIFTADHGESLGEHNYYFGHGRLPYDACSRVPLIIKVPKFKSENKVIDQPVELINIMPTILDILGMPANKEAQGRSIVPLMLGYNDSIPRYAFTESGHQLNHQRVIRTKKWKLIYIPNKDNQKIMQGMPFELYDIENDPSELNNLIHIETRIADKLKIELFKWMASARESDKHPSTEPVHISEETKENLRSLGYIQ